MADDRPLEDRTTEFLPPEPPGPEPDLGDRPKPPPDQQPTQQQPPTQQQQQQQPTQPQPPTHQQAPPPQYEQHAWQPAPGHPPPAGQPPPGQPPPGWPPPVQPPGWQPPPQGWAAPAWGYPQQPPEPGNGAAVAGFVTSIVAGSMLLISFGFLAFLSVIAAPFGIFYSRKGRQAVDQGKTRKHRGLAQAGFVIGIVTLVISAIVTVLLIIFIVALATDEQFRRDFENNRGFESTTVSAGVLAVHAAAAAIRLVV
jgi:hypothetical protein